MRKVIKRRTQLQCSRDSTMSPLAETRLDKQDAVDRQGFEACFQSLTIVTLRSPEPCKVGTMWQSGT